MLSFLNLLRNNQRINYNLTNIAVREYAARKGTRERKAKLKKKRKEESHEQTAVKKIYGVKEDLIFIKQRPIDESDKAEAVDNVYFHDRFRTKEHTFRDVVQFHKETHHETVYNKPDSPLFLRIDMDLKYPGRATKCMDPWRSLITIKSPFLVEGTILPTVLAFCQNNTDEITNVLQAGADSAGGPELITAVQKGDVLATDYDYVVCHPLVLTELASIRGLMKRKFPSIKAKTIGTNLPEVVRNLKNGLRIKVEYNSLEPDFGYIKTCMGMLNMTAEELEGNFSAIIQDTISKKVSGKEPTNFILQCHAYTPFSDEKLRIKWHDFLPPPPAPANK